MQRLRKACRPLIAPTYDHLHPWQGLLSIMQIDPSYSSTCALWPADNNSAAMCVRRTSSARHIQKISILKCDGHTYIQMQNEMRSRISCLALRRSAIIMSAKWSIPLPQPGSLLLQTLACLSSHGMLSKFHSFEKQHQLWRVGCLVMVVNVQHWYQCMQMYRTHVQT